MTKQEKTSENKVVRNKQGQIIQGTANPHGRPKGSGISITTEIKRKLKQMPEGQKATYLELLIRQILKKAIQDGDQQMLKQIWQYIDGMPKETREVTGDIKLDKVTVEIVDGNKDKSD